ncbi:hypothetical protein [Nocardioides sp. GY 10127]|uniref:hypothetical protein n=1 Tax=Nocardioides sp. GY 10127 TaxID=2569762 RepID=UPI0010A94B80|nr:hypothetical protein [Nocardioides sp. GY 10127]TIC84280.1 hypothetical protein E8D37_05750 [Nocardioides sp. GY 10127]
MTTRPMALCEDHLPAGAPAVFLPAAVRALYVASGSVRVADAAGSRWLPAGTGWVGDGEVTLSADADARLWRWEVDAPVQDGTSPEVDPARHLLRSAPQCRSELLLGTLVDLDERFSWLLRCDTVTFPPGGVAHTHLHQGPGLRVVESGSLVIETEGTARTYRPGQAWAEKGVLPVRAPSDAETGAVFVRGFLLPAQNLGTSSLRIVHAEDRAAGNTQSYRVLAEQVLIGR